MPLSIDAARTLLTPSPVVYTLDDVERTFGVRFPATSCATLDGIPYSPETLAACAGTHMLFPGYPLSLLEIRDRHRHLFATRTGGWYEEERQRFSRMPLLLRWHLLRMEPVPGSFLGTWGEQLRRLGPGEEVASAALVTFAAMLHCPATGRRLFEEFYVRTADVSAAGDHVVAGGFDASGWDVTDDWGDPRLRLHVLGLASVRKVP